IQQHFIDEANDGSIFSIIASVVALVIVNDGFDLKPIKITVFHVAEPSVSAVQILIDSGAQLVILDNDRVRHQSSIELNIAQCLLIGWVRNGEEESISPLIQG